MFDLPVGSHEERKAATRFRNYLLDQGFEMAQFSIYMRFCAGKEQVEAHTRRIAGNLPGRGKVHLLAFTDKQYEGGFFKWGRLSWESYPGSPLT